MIRLGILIFLFIPYKGLCQTRLTNREVYDFNIGDEFHYKVNFSSFASEGFKYTILSKNIFNDSLSYSYKYDNYQQRFEYSFGSEIRKLTITNLDSFIDNLYQEELNKMDTCFKDSFFYSDKFKVPVYNYTYSECRFEAPTTTEEFGAGLGKTEYERRDPSGPFYFWHIMTYYKKGGITFGSPDKAYTLGMKNISMNIHSLNLYPNPAHHEIQSATKFTSVSSIQIVDCYGKSFNPKMLTSSKMDISNFPSGIYCLIYESNGIRFIGKFVKD